MIRTRSRITRLVLAAAATIAGGSLFGACQAHIKDAFVQGSTQFMLGLLDPTVNPYLLPAGNGDSGEQDE
jgi:hypothetical protein